MKEEKPTHVNILRIDTDTMFLFQTKNILIERLSYLEDSGAFPSKYIKKIIAGKKKKWNVKIYLKKNISVQLSIWLEMVLGDDWKRSVNVMINYYALNMIYYSRMFCIKKYPNGKILTATEKDITSEILNRIKDEKRKRSRS